MILNEYKSLHTSPLRPRTATFLIRENKVLLGFKKTGFGKGYYVGIGGKTDKKETIEEAAKREVLEEINVKIDNLKNLGIVNFYFPKEEWNQEVHIFIVTDWEGNIHESNEIKPEWFPYDELPFDKMWDDARHWIPNILRGEKINANFLFEENLKVVDFIFDSPKLMM